MSCSQCYTAQVPECIEFLDIYTSLIDITNEVTVVIKITDKVVDFVIREKCLKLTKQLRSKRFIVR